MQSCFNLIRRHKYSFLFFLAIFSLGVFIRSYQTLFGDQILLFHQDNLHHLGLSGTNYYQNKIETDLSMIFSRSYTDAHPPLRNIVLNIILRNINDIEFSRLVGFIPGVLLIPVSFFFGYSMLEKSNKQTRILIALFLALVTSFMEQMVYLSFSTRPYMLMSLSQFLGVIFLLQYFREPQKKSKLFLFFFLALIAAFTHYSMYLFILPACIALIVFMIRNHFPNKILTSVLLLFLALSMLFQVQQLKKNSSLGKFTNMVSREKDYINSNSDLILFAIKTPDIFFRSQTQETSATKLNNYATCAFILYLLGLYVIFRRKQYELLILALVPLIVGLAFARLKIYPHWINSHCLYLAAPFLIAYCFAFDSILKDKVISLRVSIMLAITMLYLWSLNLFQVPLNKYYQRYTNIQRTVRYSKLNTEDFETLFSKSKENFQSNKIILVDRFINVKIRDYLRNKKVDNILKSQQPPSTNWAYSSKKEICEDFKYLENESKCDFIKNKDTLDAVMIISKGSHIDSLKKTLNKYGFQNESYIYKSKFWLIEELSKEAK